MAKITHQEMRRGRDNSVNTSKGSENYVVDDLSNAPAKENTDLDERINAFEGDAEIISKGEKMQEEVKEQSKNLTAEDTKKKLERLIFIGKNLKEIVIAGHKFELGTLSHRENNEIMYRLMNVGEAADLFTVRVLTLANALKSIDGDKLEEIEIDGTFDSAFQRKVAIIDGLQVALVEKLFLAYEELLKETEKVVYGEAVKNS